MSDARCSVHDTPATGVCARCGRYACAACLAPALGAAWCTECRARPDAQLTPSPEAKRALWLALAAFHGVLPLLPFAMWSARQELKRIEAGQASRAGQPWAVGAWWLSLGALVLWITIAFSFFR
jgi:hypothetical protein